MASRPNPAVTGSGARPDFLGAQSCASSGCHGGAGANKDQYLVWSRRDFHLRAYATLTTARSARLAEVLNIKDPTRSQVCTSCHAPLYEVPREKHSHEVNITEGVSCENCHGPAEAWIRSHTRPVEDFPRTQKVAAGMRDLKHLYVRANTCVACHQNMEPALLKAGHPELLFELDGQSVTQPRHWREESELYGPALWMVGQAAALREMSWQLSEQDPPDPRQIHRWAGLLWLLQKAGGADSALPSLTQFSFETSRGNLKQVEEAADQLARKAAEMKWSLDSARKLLRQLASTSKEFDDGKTKPEVHARRAERLVLALDRLVTALPANVAEAMATKKLDDLFRAVQSLPDFKPSAFSKQLAEFARQLE